MADTCPIGNIINGYQAKNSNRLVPVNDFCKVFDKSFIQVKDIYTNILHECFTRMSSNLLIYSKNNSQEGVCSTRMIHTNVLHECHSSLLIYTIYTVKRKIFGLINTRIIND